MYRLLLLFALYGATPLQAQADENLDGPYLTYNGNQLTAKWAWPEDRRSDSVAWSEEAAATLPDFSAFRPEMIDPRRAFHRDARVDFQDVDSIAVMSDIHGQFDAARKLLINARVIDEDNHWTYGHGHLVIVGDVFDRGPQVNDVLWLIYNVQQEAAIAGGRVHFLLGNHETMILGGDARYIHKRYLTTTALLVTPYRELYGRNTYLGRWLRSLPLTIRINDMVFVHGGFSRELLKEVNSLEKINDTYHRYLIDKDVNVMVAESHKLKTLHGNKGPLWYRGYFLDDEFTEDDIDKILRKVDASRMVVGHTSFNAIKSYFNGKVLAVDSSIKFGSTGEILLIEHGTMSRAMLFGDREPLEASTEKR